MAYNVTDDSTIHSFDTPHGFGTPHKFSKKTTPAGEFFAMVDLLYPTGRAFNIPEGSNFRHLHEAFNLAQLRVVEDAQATIDSTFPDNENFDADDASIWEYRLGITYNSALTLQQRRINILQRLAFPQNIKARQHPAYIQERLRELGFDITIYENIFFDTGGNLYQKTPQEVAGIVVSDTEYGPLTQYGGSTQYGGGGYQVIANSDTRESYSLGGVLWPTFFIGGATLGTDATIQASREKEFRTAVLKLKPAHTVAFLFVTYV